MNDAIYVLGDSHVRIFPEIKQDRFIHAKNSHNEILIQSMTAWAAGEGRYTQCLSETQTSIPNGSLILISFGEIDCRHYVPKLKRENGKSIRELIDDILIRFETNCINPLIEKYRVCCLGCYLCPNDFNHEAEYGGVKYSNPFSDIYEAKKLFNDGLSDICKRLNICFVPIFDEERRHKWSEMPERNHFYFGDSSHLGECMIPFVEQSIDSFWVK